MAKNNLWSSNGYALALMLAIFLEKKCQRLLPFLKLVSDDKLWLKS